MVLVPGLTRRGYPGLSAARHAATRRGCALLGQRRTMFIPPPSNPNAKLGFSTYAMWALCIVVVGVCYKLEQNELASKPAALKDIPEDVQKVLPSGSWLMSARPPLFCATRPSPTHVGAVSDVKRGRPAEDGSIRKGS